MIKITEPPLEYVRHHAKMFLRKGSLGLQLSSNVVQDVLLITGGPITVLRNGRWWVLGSESDWFAHIREFSIVELFEQIIPFPEAGQNCMHSEILLNAFSKDVITLSEAGSMVIKGEMPKNPRFLFELQSNNQWDRLLAFRVEIDRIDIDCYMP